jgi:hypothetical protein
VVVGRPELLLYERRLFFDKSHTNAEGCNRITDFVADEVQALLAGKAVGRTGGPGVVRARPVHGRLSIARFYDLFRNSVPPAGTPQPPFGRGEEPKGGNPVLPLGKRGLGEVRVILAMWNTEKQNDLDDVRSLLNRPIRNAQAADAAEVPPVADDDRGLILLCKIPVGKLTPRGDGRYYSAVVGPAPVL